MILIHLLLAVGTYHFPQYLLEPYWGWGYQFWSGIGSDIQEFALPITFLVVGWRIYKGYWKHVECHIESPVPCHKYGHPVPGTGHRACTDHHMHAESRGLEHDDGSPPGIRVEDITRHHEESGA